MWSLFETNMDFLLKNLKVNRLSRLFRPKSSERLRRVNPKLGRAEQQWSYVPSHRTETEPSKLSRDWDILALKLK